MSPRILRPVPRRRGSSLLWVVAGVAVAAGAVLLTVDFDQLRRDRVQAELEQRVATYVTARRAEDAAALAALVEPSVRDEFDAEHLAARWAFDRTDLESLESTGVEVDWTKGRATARAQATPSSADGEQAAPASAVAVETVWVRRDGAWYLVPSDEPWGRSRAEVLFGERRAALVAAFERYRELRLADDQTALYAMLTPADREDTTLADYLGIFGKGVMKVHDIELQEVELEDDGASATIVYELDSELDMKNWLAAGGRPITVSDPSELRRRTPQAVQWKYVDGEWYLSKEEEPKQQVTPRLGASSEGQPR